MLSLCARAGTRLARVPLAMTRRTLVTSMPLRSETEGGRVELRRADGVATLILSNPSSLNALTGTSHLLPRDPLRVVPQLLLLFSSSPFLSHFVSVSAGILFLSCFLMPSCSSLYACVSCSLARYATHAHAHIRLAFSVTSSAARVLCLSQFCSPLYHTHSFSLLVPRFILRCLSTSLNLSPLSNSLRVALWTRSLILPYVSI